MPPKYLYLIPARGGSKGIPGKNIKRLAGVPLIGHSIRHALEVAPPEDVIVSTDSERIATVALANGAKVPFIRPAELATDTASSRSVMLHALDFMNQNNPEPYNTIVLLQPTSPLRSPEDIRACIRAFEESGAQMAVTVTDARTNPYYNAFERGEDGFLHISKGDGRYTRRQDAPKVWEFNGAVYVIDAEALRKEELSRFERIVPVEMPPERSIDLDSPADWALAEEMMA